MNLSKQSTSNPYKTGILSNGINYKFVVTTEYDTTQPTSKRWGLVIAVINNGNLYSEFDFSTEQGALDRAQTKINAYMATLEKGKK